MSNHKVKNNKPCKQYTTTSKIKIIKILYKTKRTSLLVAIKNKYV